MALVKCKECGHDVSTQAEKCPNCGAPGPKKIAEQKATGIAALVVIVGGIALYMNSCSGPSSPTQAQSSEAATPKQECKSDDIQCLGDQGTVAASVYCKDNVERLAQHSVKWTDGTFDLKFSRFRWKDKAKGIITYVGDKAEFQNGFGAFTPVVYECDMAPNNKTVIEVRASEGRLPLP